MQGFKYFYINPNEAIEYYKDEKEIELYKINLKEDSKVFYFSNSVYYDNYNKTLPIGMDMGTKGIINLSDYKFSKPDKNNFRIGKIVNEEVTKFKRGEEKGHFEFGGSTVILLFKKDQIKINKKIIENSKKEIETIVKLGDSLE